MNFASFLLPSVPAGAHPREPFAEVPYEEELVAKDTALRRWWEHCGLPGRPQPVLPAPSPRGYRSTSKRRVTLDARGFLSLGDSDGAVRERCHQSPLEPEQHNALWQILHDRLSTPPYRSLAHALNWLVLRGVQRPFLILNVARMDANAVRQARRLVDGIQRTVPELLGAMMYFDPGRSDYYLEAGRPADGLSIKHLCGPSLLTLDVPGLRLRYPPTSFSQVNEAMIPILLETCAHSLGAGPADRFMDLYCGYGLFSFSLGRQAREVVAVELEGASIEAAKETARRQNLTRQMRFTSARITAGALLRILPPVSPMSEVMLLDPPRKGCEPGVVRVLASRGPRRVLHICCGTDEIADAVRDWTSNGYRLEQAEPLDLFAGTANLETLLRFCAVSS